MGESKFHWKTTYRVLRILEVNAQFLYIYLMQYDSLHFWRPSINYVVSARGEGGTVKDNLLNRPHLLKKMAWKEGVKNRHFLEDIVYGQPLVALLYRLFLE